MGKGNSGNGGNIEGRKQFDGKCRLCDKLGHKAVDFWNDDKNSSKRPRGQKITKKME